MIAELSRCAVHIGLLLGEDRLGVASALLWRTADHVWIVTAKHNLTGRHAESGAALRPDGRFPDRVRLSWLSQPKDGNREGVSAIRWSASIAPLYSDPPAPDWFQHPDSEVDVAGLRFERAAPGETDPTGEHRGVNEDLDCYSPFALDPGLDVFILGYPRGITGGGLLPVWKRATIASDPAAVQPFLLVDTATREGMSGGPAFARRTGLINPPGVTGVHKATIIGQADQFLGIYTSRPLADVDGVLAQLGRVYRRNTIEEFIADPRPGDNPCA